MSIGEGSDGGVNQLVMVICHNFECVGEGRGGVMEGVVGVYDVGSVI